MTSKQVKTGQCAVGRKMLKIAVLWFVAEELLDPCVSELHLHLIENNISIAFWRSLQHLSRAGLKPQLFCFHVLFPFELSRQIAMPLSWKCLLL